jgi:type VI secretion system secreted protein VgrG
MEVYAKQTMKVEAGDSITQTHGNDRTETVENSHHLTTRNKDIHYQSATDQAHHAGQNIRHHADKNIEHKAAENMQWRVSRHASITIKQGNQIIKIENGSLNIQAAQAIKITGTGSGNIKIGQSGAGIEIDAGGNVKLFGKQVTIDGANGVKLKGKVNWEIGAGGSLSPTALAPLLIPREQIPEEIPLKFDIQLADIPGPNGIPIPHMVWRIARATNRHQAIRSKDIVLKGKSNKQGKLVLTADDEKNLKLAYNKTPNELWLVYAGRVREFIVTQEKNYWNEKDRFYHGLDALGYSDQLYKDGDSHVDTFFSNFAAKELEVPAGSDILGKLKGKV